LFRYVDVNEAEWIVLRCCKILFILTEWAYVKQIVYEIRLTCVIQYVPMLRQVCENTDI